jgi:anti-anti-sigma factor
LILQRGGLKSLQVNGEIVKQQNRDKDYLTVDRLASVGQIAAGIAHEVRNPLTAVKGFLQLIQQEYPHKYLDIALEELEDALSTMQNLLHVSKPDLHNEEVSSINLCSELESVLYLFQEQIYHVQVVKEFTDTQLTIYGKPNQLKKAFFNLIKNAFEAIPEKGTVTIKHFLDREYLSVSISDTGVGIPQEKIALLGSPFFTSKPEGTGMGLTQVFSTIYDHNGKIEVQSEPGVGTEFMIRFPVPHLEHIGVCPLNLIHTDTKSFKDFYAANMDEFNELLRDHGKVLFESINRLPDFNESYILQATHRIVHLLNESDEYGLIIHAKEQGRKIAKHNLDLILMMDWFQMLRKLYWDFLFNYYQPITLDQTEFFELERKINYNLDAFIKHFTSSFTEYKNELFYSQNELIDDLNVPIIPLSETMAILPIVGMVDTRRARNIQESVLEQIYQQKLKHIIIDLSGVAFLDTGVLGHLFKIVNGIRIQGCRAVLTGIRPEITNTIVELGIDLHEKVQTKATLQQAIDEYNQSIVLR